MTAEQLHPILGLATVVLMQIGLFVAVFAGWNQAGLVLAMMSVFCAGAWAVVRYLAWEGP